MNGYRYAVLAWRSDCGDVAVFMIEDSRGRDHWSSFGEARAAMKEDYQIMLAEYPFDPFDCGTRSGRRRRKHRIRRSSAGFSVPIWDVERKHMGFLKCKWRIVRI